MERALSADPGFNFEFRILRRDGEERYVRARGEIHRDDKGRSTLIEGTLLDFTERKQIELSLERSKQMLKQLAGHLQSVREEERSGIAREIHDELGQSLTAMKVDLVRLRSRLGEPAPAVDALLQSLVEGVSTTLDTVQQLMSQLRPSILDNLGLIPAIEWQTEQFRERTGIDCSFRGPGCELALTPAASTALFRILQESLTNVARHAGASRVSVELKREERWVKLSIQDNGRGITDLEQQSSTSFGLLGMRERAEVFGGQVEFHRLAARGTQVLVCVPLSAVSGWSSHA
jgi:signal transduction histidine kinase